MSNPKRRDTNPDGDDVGCCANCVGATLFILAALYVSFSILMLSSHPANLVNSHRGFIESGTVSLADSDNTTLFLASGIALPDYACVKSFSLLFYAKFKQHEENVGEDWTGKFAHLPEFWLECFDDSYPFFRTPLFKLSLGRVSDRFEPSVFFKRSRIPTVHLKGGKDDRGRCFLYATHPLPNASALVWRLHVTPRWHWTDWFSRTITDEYYRAVAVIGLRIGDLTHPDFWYDGMGLYEIEEKQEYHEAERKRYAASLASEEFATRINTALFTQAKKTL